VQPSSKREGFATVPDVSWDDIGALQTVREELKTAILAPVKFARQCEIFNFTKPPGILMVGPPGCGKTLLAKAIAKESGVNFISVKGPELLNMYVGESERAVRSLFQRARNSKPCVIFFDEIDAICVKRSESTSDGGATTRVVNQMLTEMDGLESRKGVFLMAASNRPGWFQFLLFLFC
jgi:ribosome biogenesis ATPase